MTMNVDTVSTETHLKMVNNGSVHRESSTFTFDLAVVFSCFFKWCHWFLTTFVSIPRYVSWKEWIVHCYVSLPGGLCSKTKTHPGIKKDTIFKPIGHERQRRGLGEYLGQPGGMGCMLMQGLQGWWVEPRFLILGGLLCFGGWWWNPVVVGVYELLHGNLLYWMIC